MTISMFYIYYSLNIQLIFIYTQHLYIYSIYILKSYLSNYLNMSRSQSQYDKVDHKLPELKHQSYLFKNKYFSQKLLTFEEDKEIM